MDKLLFFQENFSLLATNLLNPKLDNYLIYGFILGLLLISLLSLVLIIRREKLLLPAFFLAILITSGFFYVREYSPWSRYLKPSPPPAPVTKLKIEKLGEAVPIPPKTTITPGEKLPSQ